MGGATDELKTKMTIFKSDGGGDGRRAGSQGSAISYQVAANVYSVLPNQTLPSAPTRLDGSAGNEGEPSVCPTNRSGLSSFPITSAEHTAVAVTVATGGRR